MVVSDIYKRKNAIVTKFAWGIYIIYCWLFDYTEPLNLIIHLRSVCM